MAKNEKIVVKYYHLDWRDFDYNIYQKNFSEMYEHLTKKIEDILSQKEKVNIITPGIETAVLVNKIAASKYGENEFKIIAVKDDEFKFKLPDEDVIKKIIGCDYSKLFDEIAPISINSQDFDQAEQLRLGLIKRGF